MQNALSLRLQSHFYSTCMKHWDQNYSLNADYVNFLKLLLQKTLNQTKIFKPSYHSEAYKNTFLSHSHRDHMFCFTDMSVVRWRHFFSPVLSSLRGETSLAFCIIVTGGNRRAVRVGGPPRTSSHATIDQRPDSSGARALSKGIFLGRSERPLLLENMCTQNT